MRRTMPPDEMHRDREGLRTVSRLLLALPWAGSLGVLLSLLWLSGCATSKSSHESAEPVSPLIWPAPPDPPRIQYVRSIRSPADLGIRASAFARFGRWLTGSDKGNETFIKPFGLALDDSNNLCLTDTGANAVACYDRAKKKWMRWERIGKLNFAAPVAVAKKGTTIYVADAGLGCVLAFDERGALRSRITNHIEHPSGLAVNGDRLFVADAVRHCVVVLDLQGGYQSEIGRRGAGPGQFNFPTHLATDRSGNLFVTDSLNGRVQMFDSAGQFLGQIGSLGDRSGQFSRPKGVATDSSGNVYVLDSLFDNIQIFDRSGRLLLALGAAGSQPGEFWLPNGIAVSSANEIFVSDSYNHRIQEFRYIGPP